MRYMYVDRTYTSIRRGGLRVSALLCPWPCSPAGRRRSPGRRRGPCGIHGCNQRPSSNDFEIELQKNIFKITFVQVLVFSSKFPHHCKYLLLRRSAFHIELGFPHVLSELASGNRPPPLGSHVVLLHCHFPCPGSGPPPLFSPI